ncbi:hypothetical protein OG413_45250 [Streptomyces sp. NBC_01433]|nr:hypothetical protein [Streptomyces sp. NBC_01433]MCX4681317.1 hypothetical protein [Streptomyces sp. NBC_01433]MCX4682394.1 hypothetical protein [Streptomyces sp. NBC_01433]
MHTTLIRLSAPAAPVPHAPAPRGPGELRAARRGHRPFTQRRALPDRAER